MVVVKVDYYFRLPYATVLSKEGCMMHVVENWKEAESKHSKRSTGAGYKNSLPPSITIVVPRVSLIHRKIYSMTLAACACACAAYCSVVRRTHRRNTDISTEQ
jgi:hypothetical protein